MPRAIWSGSISFGLVSVPVKLFSAQKQKDTRFHQLDRKTGARIRYKRVSEKSGREVPYEQIVKGFELGKDRFVMIDPEELEELDPEPTQRIDIEDFVKLEEIDPIFFERAYYLAPDRGGAKAYKLLLTALEETATCGIGKMVMRNRQYLTAVRAKDRALCLETMLFADEVVDAGSIDGLPDSSVRVGAKEVEMATRLIESLTTSFDAEKYRDDYRRRVQALIKKKAEGEIIEPPAPEKVSAPIDLMEALRASVEAAGKPRKRAHGHRSGRGRRSA